MLIKEDAVHYWGGSGFLIQIITSQFQNNYLISYLHLMLT